MIHDTAIISDTAVIADDVDIGPYSIIGDQVEISAGSKVESHVVINGPTRIGENNHIYQFASIGDDPQDKKYQGEDTRLEIGDRNTIREYCTISRGTVQDQRVTRLGDHSNRRSMWRFECSASVDGKQAVSAVIMCAPGKKRS